MLNIKLLSYRYLIAFFFFFFFFKGKCNHLINTPPKGNVNTTRLSQTQTNTGIQNNTNIPSQLPHNSDHTDSCYK
jgi:hypothetical protein